MGRVFQYEKPFESMKKIHSDIDSIKKFKNPKNQDLFSERSKQLVEEEVYVSCQNVNKVLPNIDILGPSPHTSLLAAFKCQN